MANVISTDVRFGATVTFHDGSSTVVHGQADNHQSWSIDQAESFETSKQLSWYEQPSQPLWPYYAAINIALERIPGIIHFSFNESHFPVAQKAITDMAGRIDIVVGLDNQQTVSIGIILNGTNSEMYLGGDIPSHVSISDLVSGTPIQPFIDRLEAALLEAMEDITLTHV